MSQLTVAVFSVFSIVYLFIIFHSTHGVPFDSSNNIKWRERRDTTFDTALTKVSRKKRESLDSMTSVITSIINAPFNLISYIASLPLRIISMIFLNPLSYILNIVTSPIRLVQFIFYIISVPFYYIFLAIIWPIKYIFLADNQAELTYSSNGDVLSTQNFSQSAITEKLNASLRQVILELMVRGWNMLRTVILPYFDKFIQNIDDSDVISADVKANLEEIHSLYEMLHSINVV